MAVFTPVSDEEISIFLTGYDCGTLIKADGILAGVENTNYLLTTTKGRYILTVVEYRTAPEALPFIVGYQRHLKIKGFNCPPPIDGKIGAIQGKPALLSPFISGAGVTDITLGHVQQLGAELARMHVAGMDFAGHRDNPVGVDTWQKLAEKIGDRFEELQTGLTHAVHDTIAKARGFHADIPRGAVHVDAFPDNVFFEPDGRFSGVIDFYFSCTDYLAYDLAVVANAWTFDAAFYPRHDYWRAFIDAYQSVRPLSDAEKAAYPFLRRCAAMRFLLTRAHDWFFRPADALVTPKNPGEYVTKMACDANWF